MTQLYKTRTFSDFFQDTFAFLKHNGKHFFGHYITVNGVFLLIMMVFMYFFVQFYTDIVFGGYMGNSSMFGTYIDENAELFVGLFVLFLIFAIVAAVVSFAFMPIYFKLFAERGGANFRVSDIVAEYKKNFGKILIFLLCGILLGIPLAMVAGVGMFLLVITIVGMLLIPVLIGIFSLWYNMTLMEYLEQKRSIWESFGYAWTLMTSKFWASAGSVGLFLVIAYLIQSIISMIPYIFGMASMFTDFESGNPEHIGSTMGMIMMAMFFLNFFVGAFLGVVVQINEGIVFYSLKEGLENVNTKNVIDQIGSGE